MGKASRAKQDPDRRMRIAAQRAAARRQQQLTRLYLGGGAIIAVIVIVVLIVTLIPGSKPAPAKGAPTGAQLTSVISNVTSVPSSVLDKVGTGSVPGFNPNPVLTLKGGTPLTEAGKPEMLYMGAEYCPYCAAERWGMIVALSRFGSFTGLQTTHSSSTDVNPNTPTWTFVHAKYTSKYLAFTPVEMQSNVIDKATNQYATLQTPTAAQQAIITKYDAPPNVPQQDAGAIPFVDFGNKYMLSGASYNGAVLGGKSWTQIATALKDPSSPIAQGVDGTANYITAAICKLTNNQPATACTPAVTKLEGSI